MNRGVGGDGPLGLFARHPSRQIQLLRKYTNTFERACALNVCICTYILDSLDDRQVPVALLHRLERHALVGGVQLEVVGDPPVWCGAVIDVVVGWLVG